MSIEAPAAVAVVGLNDRRERVTIRTSSITSGSPQYMPSQPLRNTFDVHALLADVAKGRPLFHSEADFQHAVAWELHRRFPHASVRLERPVSTGGKVMHLDVLVQEGAAMIAIELKYKTRKFSAELSGETYNLRNQAAHDVGRYDFIKDIHRLEEITHSKPGAIGYAVLLTNDSAYWKATSTTTTVDAAFRLHQGRVLEGTFAWGNGASAGTMKAREAAIDLLGRYSLEWRDFLPLPGKGWGFRYLAVAIADALF